MSILSFQDKFFVEITGTGSLADELEEYYEKLMVDTASSTIDIEVSIREFESDPDLVLGKPNVYFGREGDWFIRSDKYKQLRIKKDWSVIDFSPEVPKSWIFKLIEFRARCELAREGFSLAHASGVTIGDTTVAFPAWRHTGKTNTLMTLLEEYGTDYLSDDRLWLDNHGSVHGFPLPINLQPYNYNAFPDIDPPSRFYDHRYQLSNEIRDRTSDTGPFFTQALYFLNEFYLVPPTEKVHIEEVYPEVNYCNEATLDALVCLQTMTSSENGVELSRISTERVVDYLSSISHYEWDGVLQDYATSFDLLFEDESVEAELRELQERESEVWEQLAAQVDTYMLEIPREENWKEINLSQDVLEALSPLID